MRQPTPSCRNTLPKSGRCTTDRFAPNCCLTPTPKDRQIAKYVLPFVFVFAPGMVFVGSWDEIILSIIGGFAGIYALTITTEGWLISRVGWTIRVMMAVCALFFFVPGLKTALFGIKLNLPYLFTHLVGWVILVVGYFLHRARHSRLNEVGVT